MSTTMLRMPITEQHPSAFSATKRTDMEIQRRRLVQLILGCTAAFGAGCTPMPRRRAGSEASYCYRTGRSYRPTLTCMPSPIPGEEAEGAAKRFEAAADRLTVYVVRKRWADSKGVVHISSDSGPSVDTVPQSFVRLRVPAGRHRLTATWPEGTTGLDISGRDGEIVYVELVGAAWSWGSKYRLKLGSPADSRQRAERLRLVADVG